MKYIFSSLFTIIVLASLISCDKGTVKEPSAGLEYPVAAFSFTGNEGPAPVDIQFSNYSETIIEDHCTYEWTFGENGPNSDEKNPMHTFYNNTSSTKVFLVTLEVLDLESNLSQRRSIAIQVLPAE